MQASSAGGRNQLLPTSDKNDASSSGARPQDGGAGGASRVASSATHADADSTIDTTPTPATTGGDAPTGARVAPTTLARVDDAHRRRFGDRVQQDKRLVSQKIVNDERYARIVAMLTDPECMRTASPAERFFVRDGHYEVEMVDGQPARVCDRMFVRAAKVNSAGTTAGRRFAIARAVVP